MESPRALPWLCADLPHCSFILWTTVKSLTLISCSLAYSQFLSQRRYYSVVLSLTFVFIFEGSFVKIPQVVFSLLILYQHAFQFAVSCRET